MSNRESKVKIGIVVVATSENLRSNSSLVQTSSDRPEDIVGAVNDALRACLMESDEMVIHVQISR